MELKELGMNISVTRLDFDESMMWVDLSDGRKIGVPLAYFPRLLRDAGAALAIRNVRQWHRPALGGAGRRH